jgi:pyruvate/2-oxoglutarate dehydrogenase complex dihydrolipoamide dehydrogenase (E3) component
VKVVRLKRRESLFQKAIRCLSATGGHWLWGRKGAPVLYADKRTDRLLEAIVGPQASELINEIALAKDQRRR